MQATISDTLLDPSLWSADTPPHDRARIMRQAARVIEDDSQEILVLSMRSVAPALALGNAVVLKPDPQIPVCGGFFWRAYLKKLAHHRRAIRFNGPAWRPRSESFAAPRHRPGGPSGPPETR
jgi:hypothetical protein